MAVREGGWWREGNRSGMLPLSTTPKQAGPPSAGYERPTNVCAIVVLMNGREAVLVWVVASNLSTWRFVKKY